MKNSNQYNVFAGNLLSFPTKEKSIIIPEGVKCIPTSLFYDNNNIERIVFPKSLVSIGESAFEDCKSLKSVDISASALKTLPNKCFWGCISLKNFIFNKSLESCSHSSFGNSGLNEYRLPVSLKFFIMPYLPIYHPSFDVNKKIYIFVSGKDTVIYFNDWNNKYINNYIIYAPSGSAAEKSAHEIGIEFIPTD
ncbi:hypothetical protein SDC9_159693 [bioreactor metagenome]|uniref:Leucine-rich repeat domain-containing protein n=1 Tax=bioreactor metagenome TaxID=1076179 RepID=A0A645FD91_9ZZZZ